MVTKSSSFVVLFLTTLGMITSIIPPLNAQENIEYQAGTLQQQQNRFQYNTQDFQTFTKYMDMYNELYPPQPQQQQGSNYNDFLTFMQYLQYYDNLHGQKDYIIKLYDNDDDKDYKYKYKYKKDFEEYKKKKYGQGDREGTKGGLWNPDNRYHPDYAGDDRKYCTDNGVWKDGKCNIEDDEERANYEDIVCDDGPSKACGNIIRDKYTEKEIEEQDLLDDPRYWNDEPQRQEQKKPDYDSYEEYNEIVEPICKEHGGKINYGSGECGFDDDIDRAKSTAFEKELDDRGLGADYTAEEEASWNQNQDEVEPKQVSNVSPQFELEQQKQQEERAKMTQSKSFEKFVESKGIDIDDEYHGLSAEEQKQIETEFKEDKSDEYAEEINNKEEENEGKRYVNPDGGAPLYEDELTEDEKDYYEEYKAEKEETIEDWKNEVTTTEGEEATKQILAQQDEEQGYPVESSPTQTLNDSEESSEEEVEDNSSEEEQQQEEEEQEEPEQEEESNEDEESEEESEEEDNSDSESESDE